MPIIKYRGESRETVRGFTDTMVNVVYDRFSSDVLLCILYAHIIIYGYGR